VKNRVQRGITTFLAGLLFGIGLCVSGMTRPSKVIGFLDVAGAWDASLLLVMVGAVAVHFVGYRVIVARRSAPLLAERFSLPVDRGIDLTLVGGAALFGIGWALGGYCPGPAVVSLASGGVGAFVFVTAMALSTFVTGKLVAFASGVKRAGGEGCE
jgi:uncharacterized protein